MFEKFTEKAINVLTTAQEKAAELKHDCVYPEHLLLGLITQKTCLSTKLLSFSGVKQDLLLMSIKEHLKNKETANAKPEVCFSDDLKNVLKRAFDIAKNLNNSYILTEHLFLSLLSDNSSQVKVILEDFNLNIPKTVDTVCKFLDKKKKLKATDYHPENISATEIKSDYQNIDANIKDSRAAKIFEKAAAKLTTSNYEILGTEQIIQAILEDTEENPELIQIFNEFGINAEVFSEKLNEVKNRNDEFEEKQIIFTPNAFKTIMYALETAKELGSVTLEPEHIILGLLKSKNGIAYNIFKKLNVNDSILGSKIVKPIERQMPETLTILRLAKQETRRLGKNIVGSEMILLGILDEGAGIGAEVLSDLGVTIRDVRSEIEKIVGFGDEYNDAHITFTERAKKILETAWDIARKNSKQKINSEHLLEAISMMPNSIAMRVLTNLGVDVIEIKQGILKFL